MPGLIWKIYRDPAEVGEAMGDFCVLVVGTPAVVAELLLNAVVPAAEVPVDEVPELGASEMVVSDISCCSCS